MAKNTKEFTAALKVPQSTEDSIIFKWKKLGTTRTLPRPGRPDKLTNSRDAVRRWEKVLQSQLSLQPSTSRGFSGPTETSPQYQTYENPHRVYQEAHEGLLDSSRLFSGLMRPRLNFLALILRDMCGEKQPLLGFGSFGKTILPYWPEYKTVFF